jgi:hypothetical protein
MASFSSTLSSAYISPLLVPENGVGDITVRYQIPFTQINTSASTTSGDTYTLLLGTLGGIAPTSWAVGAAYGVVVAPFVGAAVTSLTVAYGTTTTTTAFLAATAVTSAVGTIIQSTNGINAVNTPTSSVGTTMIQQAATFTIQGAGFNALTSGYVVLNLSLTNPLQEY